MPHRVRMERLAEPWPWTTANGSVVRAEPGDFRVTDARTGAQWSVAPQALRSGYVEISPGEYESAGEVTAYQVDGRADLVVPSLEGRVVACPGDWVITAADGSQWVVVDSWFRTRYEPMLPVVPKTPRHSGSPES